MKQRRGWFLPYFYNPISYLGGLIALLVFVIEAFLFALDFLAHGHNLYLGLITYAMLPPFLILGLILIAVGAIRQRWRVLKGIESAKPHAFSFDPTNPHHRNTAAVFVTGTAILVLMSVVGAYKAFHYTESIEFCGVLCHGVMRPEFEAYKKSPHSRVLCVHCHVGTGADYYLRSKLSGMRQVAKYATKTYNRPTPSPVHSLRPAPETCEQCHSPGQTYSSYDLRRTYFPASNEGEPWHVRMFIKVGGKGEGDSGIHAHMNLEHEIYYAAADEKRQEIDWVKTVDKHGKEIVFVSGDSSFGEAGPPPEKIRRMDCIDCHNRPSHKFLAPYRIVDDGLWSGQINRELDNIKERSLKLLSDEYETAEEARTAIRAEIKEDPKTADYLVKSYESNFFPFMKTRWDSNPDNIGHMVSAGCFRCHDGEHRSAEGKAITRDCDSCHLIVEQGPAGAVEKNIEGLEFRHPEDDDSWKEMSCHDCHTGGAM